MIVLNRTLLAGLLLLVISPMLTTWAATPTVVGALHQSILQKSDGTLWGWGSNEFGDVGDGTSVLRNTPVKVRLSIPATLIAAAGLSSYAIGSDGHGTRLSVL